MSYNSDLDLIFVYDSEVDGRGREVAARIAQKLIAILEARTREGYAYKLDLRLRPSGNQGPLVTSLEGFRDYHRQSSAVWERQALVRARVVAGDPSLGEEVEAARREFVFGRGLATGRNCRNRADAHRGWKMRSALRARRASISSRAAAGWSTWNSLAQMMALAHGHEHPALRKRATRELLAELEWLQLITREEAAALREGYEFIARLENRLRIESDQPAWALPTNPDALRPLARRMGYQGSGGAASTPR